MSAFFDCIGSGICSANSTVMAVALCIGALWFVPALVHAQVTIRPHILEWNAPTEGSTPDGYVLDRSTDHGQNWSRLTTQKVTGLTYTDSTLTQGQEYCYRAKSTLGTQESDDASNMVCATAKAYLLAPGQLRCNITLSDCQGF